MFLLFSGNHCYPFGGWNDYIGQYDTLAMAQKVARDTKSSADWFHVVDLSQATIVWTRERNYPVYDKFDENP